MKNRKHTILAILSGLPIIALNAQISESNLTRAHRVADRTLEFNVTDAGKSTPIIWGLDLAWLDEWNIRRGIAFMDNENVSIIRSSFTPTAALINGELPATELGRLNDRLNLISRLGRNMDLVLNCDHPSVHEYYTKPIKILGNIIGYTCYPGNWHSLIKKTKELHEATGHRVVTVSPFNEPDYSATGQGKNSDFKNIAKLIKDDPDFNGVRVSGGNTLNNDKAWEWYNYLKDNLDEGNTHQLAGSFDTYAEFFTKVRNEGKHASNDELHNVMEAMVGAEYGMQTGIWWGTAEYARGEFVKATNGSRLAYAEHRPNWTAASVYKTVDGRIQAFAGVSERQAATTTYRFVSKDRDVYFDGVGPQREYVLEMPAGTGYQVDQVNAEKVINITYGDDIQPVIDGKYYIVNRKSGKVLTIQGGSNNLATNLVQTNANNYAYQKWSVVPVSNRVGGDFSYFHINSEANNLAVDVLNWSLDNNGGLITYSDAKGTNQQWFLEYADDGYFYIRSRHSALCMQPLNKSSNNNVSVIQYEKNGDPAQQWRFVPITSSIEFVAPQAPSNIIVSENNLSVNLRWNNNSESDLAGYNIYRSESENGEYTTIAQNVTSTSFVDNRIDTGVTYYYKIKAVDKSLNKSEYSEVVSAMAMGGQEMFVTYKFENNLNDLSDNLINASIYGEETYINSYNNTNAISLNGIDNFIQLPYNIANHSEMSISMWVNRESGDDWQRIFDFGSDENNYMFFTAQSGWNDARFVMKNGNEEQVISLPTSTIPIGVWTHITITISNTSVKIFKDGIKVAESTDFTISPTDIKPIYNYIGRSMFAADPLFKGAIDDFKLFNYALSDSYAEILPGEVANGIQDLTQEQNSLNIWPVPAKDYININLCSNENYGEYTAIILDTNGRIISQHTLSYNEDCTIDVSMLNKGIYIMNINDRNSSIIRRIIKE